MPSEPEKTADEVIVVPAGPVQDNLPARQTLPPLGGQDQPPLGLTKTRLALAFAIAGISDAISLVDVMVPPVQWTVDIITAALLFAVLGWRWLLLPGLIMEAIPGVGVMPFWVMAVAAVAVWGTIKPKLN